MKVAVIGVGPSGMAAALAAIDHGDQVVLFDRSHKPSQLFGCQYLHAPIPGFMDAPQTNVTYQLIGSATDYRRKVYGDSWFGKVSPEGLAGNHQAWDIRDTYRRMRNTVYAFTSGRRFTYNIQRGQIDYIRLHRPDAIISTIPAPALCYRNHEFRSHEIYAQGSRIPVPARDPDFIICDGTDNIDWYRSSCVFGYTTMEWPLEAEATIPKGAVKVRKPLVSYCDCHPEVIRAGRYGEWRKGRLVSHVYSNVWNALEERK